MIKRKQIIDLLIKNEGKEVYVIDDENLAIYKIDLTKCIFDNASLTIGFEGKYVESLFPISEIEVNLNVHWLIDDDEEEFFESIEELKQSEYCEDIKRKFFECFTKTTL